MRPSSVTSAGSATCCGRCPAPRPRRTGAALHGAAEHGRAEICRVPLAAGAEVDARDNDGLSALKRWIYTVLGADFKVPKIFELKM